ncbi:hypothetical protein EPN90_04675 [Patescibacteria group bacterium]|nr:MAG: hypothetical protein EPN90_04675 [Patescibacteria group bacterium]
MADFEVEAERRRELVNNQNRLRGLAESAALPTVPAASTMATMADESAARSRLERARFQGRNSREQGKIGQTAEAVKQAKELAELAQAATPAGAAKYVGKKLAAEAKKFITGTPEEKREQLWAYFWRGFMLSLEQAVEITLPTLIIPAFLTLILAFIYAFRLVRVNLLNSNKPVKFPLFGITDLYVSPLKFPEEHLRAAIWMTLGLVIVLLVITLTLFVLTLISGVCQSVGYCLELPGLSL